MAYRLVGKAESGVTRIIVESVRQFGFDAAERYEQLLRATFTALGNTPNRPASQELPEVPGVRVFPLHLGRHLVDRRFRVGRPPHIVVYRVASDGVVEILGVAHDRMLLARSARRMQREADR